MDNHTKISEHTTTAWRYNVSFRLGSTGQQPPELTTSYIVYSSYIRKQ
jgi:hypothetical protein